jgi:hypothetical protein
LLVILNPRLGIAIRLAGIVVTRSLSTHDGISWKEGRVVTEGERCRKYGKEGSIPVAQSHAAKPSMEAARDDGSMMG